MGTAVLVVDDIPEVVDLVAKMLRDSDHDVLEATDGGTALEILQTEAIDVLVTDVRMPGITGPELVRRAWEFAPDLPVVFITGYSVADELPCEMLSRALIVTKPFIAKALRDAIAQALRDRARPARRSAGEGLGGGGDAGEVIAAPDPEQ